MLFKFLGMVVLSIILWQTQDFIASFAASEMVTQATLRTTEERDDARALRAFRTAKETLHIRAELVTESNPEQRTRDAVLTIRGPSKKDVLEKREAMTQTMLLEFKREGPGEIFDISPTPSARPVPNATMALIKQAMRIVSVMIFLLGLAMLLMQWKSSRLPIGALLGILATVLTLFFYMTGGGGTVLAAILPVAILSLITYLTMRVKRAATWLEGRARITKSEVEVERHRFEGDTTQVRNKPLVHYEFKVGSEVIHGERISIGMASADNVDVVLKRYALGCEVPVFYDPENPMECVLERKPPVSLGCLWTGAFIVLLLYGLGLAWFVSDKSFAPFVASMMPQGVHHPVAVLVLGLLALLCLAAGFYHALNPTQTVAWLRTAGTIVSSEVESYRESSSSSGSPSRTYYKAVIEFSYEVEGQTYHNTVGSVGPLRVSVSGTQAMAEAQAAKYKAGMPVDVFYHPENHTQSSLTDHPAITLNGRRSLIMGAILIAIAVYLATH